MCPAPPSGGPENDFTNRNDLRYDTGYGPFTRRPLAGKSPLNHYQLVISVDVGARVCSAVLNCRSVKRGWGTNVSLDNRGSASPGSILLGRPAERDSAPGLTEAGW